MQQVLINERKYARLSFCASLGIFLTVFFLIPYIWSFVEQTHPSYAWFWKGKYQKEVESIRKLKENHAKEIHNLKEEFMKSKGDTQKMKLWKAKYAAKEMFWKQQYQDAMKLSQKLRKHHEKHIQQLKKEFWIKIMMLQTEHEKTMVARDRLINLWKRKYEKKEENSVQDNSNIFFYFLGAFFVIVVGTILNPEPKIEVVEVHSVNGTECKVCMERNVEAVFVPCGHAFCYECACQTRVCPLCQQNDQIVKLFFP